MRESKLKWNFLRLSQLLLLRFWSLFLVQKLRGGTENSCPTVKNVFVSLVQLLVLTTPWIILKTDINGVSMRQI